MIREKNGPFHLVSLRSGKHIGPFTTYTDALLASYIANDEYATINSHIMDDAAFAQYLDSK